MLRKRPPFLKSREGIIAVSLSTNGSSGAETIARGSRYPWLPARIGRPKQMWALKQPMPLQAQ